MKRTRRRALIPLAALVLNACASSSDDISASYVSPIRYQSYKCTQLEQEYDRLLQHSAIANSKQDGVAEGDAVAMGVGLVLFWPALFFLAGGDNKEEVAKLKGELNAIESAAIHKDCFTLTQQMKKDRKAAEEARKKREEAARENDYPQ